MSKVQVAVDYISVVDGQRQGNGGNRNGRGSPKTLAQRPGISINNPSGLFNFKPSKGTLVVFAEPDLPGGVDAGPLVADWVNRAFNDDSSASVVSGLNRALHTAHQRLSKENLKSLSSDRRGVALACVVVRDRDLYLAQVGPTLALRFRGSELSIIGEVPPAEPISFACTLGQDCEIDIHLCHEKILPGDIVLLCSTALLKMADGSEIVRCLQNDSSKAIADSLYHLHEVSLDPEDFTAVVLMFDRPGSNARRKRSQAVEHDESYNDAYRGGRQTDANVRYSTQRASRTATRTRRYWDVEEPSLHQVEEADVSGRRRGGRREEDRSSSKKRRDLPGDVRGRGRKIDLKRIGLFGVLPLVVLIGVLSFAFLNVQGYQTRGQQEQAVSILQKAEQAEREAQSIQDIVLKRRLLSEAERLASQVLAAKPDDRYVFTSRERIRKELDGLTNAVRIPSARRLVDLGQEAKDSDPVDLIVQGIDLYVLDKGSDRVYKFLLDASGDQLQPNASPVIIKGFDKIGDVTVGRVAAMTWVPAGGTRLRAALVIMDDVGKVYEYDPTRGLTVLKSTGTVEPDLVQSLGGYAGSLYILVPRNKQLVWFPPTSQGYDKGPYNYVNPEAQIDLTGAIDFAVDSSVFVLYSNGKIERFYAGRPQQFDSSVADMPLKEPTSIFASQSTNSVYVVDGGNQRIVQFSRDGHFERQFRYGGPDSIFSNLRGISVDEQRGKLYFLSGKNLFVADIPK